ncbi:MAG: PEP-CTERM sorting domain-containing protein [Rhodocyclaceae bacterium]|nr:PEP-CTERM sorting domain-containing protein [Rhodocyclaceae bacterium]
MQLQLESNTAGVGIIRWDGANTSFAQSAADDLDTNILNAVGSVSAVGFAAENLSATALGFAITVIQADAGFPFTLQAFSGANSSTVGAIALATATPNTFFVPFSAFAFGTQVGTGADFTAITALQAVINWPGAAVANVDLTIDLVERVPEPGALALVGLALAGLGLSRRFGRKTV